MRDTAPQLISRARINVGWPKRFKPERVAICFIDMVESGHLNVPLEKLPDFLRAKGYPQIAWAVAEQVKARHVQRLIGVGKDDALTKRKLIKDIINGR